MSIPEEKPRYRQLLDIEGFRRLVASMMLARVAGQMVALVLVLFALERYASPGIAGLVTFMYVMPGLVLSPVAGALLDRHGRARLIILDYLVAAAALALIAALAVTDRLPVAVFVAIVTVASVTQPLSSAGIRTLFPLLVPQRLWERANAIDSNGYVVSSIVAPALAGGLVAAFGGAVALSATAAFFVAAAIATIGLRDPATRTPRGPLLREAWAGVGYVARHPTLRGLALAVSTSNVGYGLFFLGVPVLLVSRLGQGADVVGLTFALLGAAGFVSVLLFGRVRTEGRERQLMGGSMVAMAAAFALVVVSPTALIVAVAMVAVGIATGPFDVVLFTIRQRRTDPAWLGRAFAVSMALNFAGFPIGSAVGGAVAPVSLELMFALAAALDIVAAVFAFVLIPTRDDRVRW